MTNTLRNIAIIAHVDHGKTTLIDSIFRQSGDFRENVEIDERAMDNQALEKERGITILAKCTSIQWQDTRINIIDTPGHADFGGEVERVLNMADGVILLVDAAEGPLPQTKFVLGKALAQGLRPLVVINKVDRPDGRPDEVLDEVFDLFVALEADDNQLDFPVLYASGRDGWAVEDIDNESRDNLHPLMNAITDHVPAPPGETDAPFAMLATLLDADPYLGRVLTGRVHQGTAKQNMNVKAIDIDGKLVERFRLTKLFSFEGTQRVPVNEVKAGDIICVAGMQKASVSNTIGDTSVETPIPADPVDPPTMAVTLSVNDSPLAGREGSRLTSTMIRDRLYKEAESNVAIDVQAASDSESYELSGRGELQLGVLIEQMRREGYEMSVSRPRVLFQQDDNGNWQEPYDDVIIDVDDDYTGPVMDKLTNRKGEMRDMRPAGQGKTRITFTIPSRGLIGYRSQFLTDTRGTGMMNRLFNGYGPYKGAITGRHKGVLISTEQGEAVPYALFFIQDRGVLFIEAGDMVYEGMIIGEHARDNDLEVNPLKAKKLTNVRSSGSDDAIVITPPRRMSLEEMIAYIDDDELLEVTPNDLRLRKKHLTHNARVKANKQAGV